MVEPGIEPGTSWLVVRSSDHQATRMVNDEGILNAENEYTYKDVREPGKLGPVTGREEEIRRTVQVPLERTTSNQC